MSDIAKQLEEAKAKRAGAEKTRVETHNAAFVAAYLKKLEGADDSDAFVEVDPARREMPFKFPDAAQHALFKRHLNVPNKPVEMGPCKTYSVHCAVFPSLPSSKNCARNTMSRASRRRPSKSHGQCNRRTKPRGILRDRCLSAQKRVGRDRLHRGAAARGIA